MRKRNLKAWGVTIAPMIPMRTSTIFKNRWWALLWAAGIIWFAYDFAGSRPQDDGNNSAAADDQNAAASVLGN
jgi:hypothetical protein